jgi:protein TonB
VPAADPVSNQVTARTGNGSARTSYIAAIRSKIEKHKEYPLLARRRMLEGTAVVRFSVARDGSLKGVDVLRSSGSEMLDRAALNAIRAAGGFPPPPPEFAGSETTLELPLSFRLSRTP